MATIIRYPNFSDGPDFDTQIARFTPRQMEAVRLLDSGKIKFLLYGGALGGGKSYFLRWYGVRRLMVLSKLYGINGASAMLACEDYPSLEDRQLQKIIYEVPPWIGRYYDKHKAYGRCLLLNKTWGSGALCFRNLDDPSKYQSSEWSLILVDELTKNPADIFAFLTSRLRLPGLPNSEAQFIGGTNPGGIGHGWVKALWMDKDFPTQWYENEEGIDYRSMFAYVPSKATDNPYLPKEYWASLSTLPDHLREAFRDGSWEIFAGQAFPELTRERHGCDPVPIPKGAHIYCTHDYGYSAPFSFGWWWVDGDGRVYRFAEWYGWTGSPGKGLSLPDSEVAERVIAKEKSILPEWCRPEDVQRIAGPDLFSKKPNPMGQGQGPPTAETYAKVGRQFNHSLIFRVGDPSRHLKIRQFHERLRFKDVDGSRIKPMMMIYKGCDQFFRTISSMIQDKNKIEDVDTTGEDHIYDEACHICMARPLALPEAKPKLSATDKRIDRLLNRKRDTHEEVATMDQDLEMRRLQSGRDAWEGSDDSDDGKGEGGGGLVETI